MRQSLCLRSNKNKFILKNFTTSQSILINSISIAFLNESWSHCKGLWVGRGGEWGGAWQVKIVSTFPLPTLCVFKAIPPVQAVLLCAFFIQGCGAAMYPLVLVQRRIWVCLFFIGCIVFCRVDVQAHNPLFTTQRCKHLWKLNFLNNWCGSTTFCHTLWWQTHNWIVSRLFLISLVFIFVCFLEEILMYLIVAFCSRSAGLCQIW